jgi:hypothetical protein
MDLKTAKLVVFALFMESAEGVTAKSPRWAGEMWEVLEAIKSRKALETALLPDMAAKFANYCKVWGKVEDGLTEELPAAAAAEAKKEEKPPAEKSESAKGESTAAELKIPEQWPRLSEGAPSG